jgi:O-antigen/teichoic acid export membrane protein
MFHYCFPLTLSSSFGVLLVVADRFSLNFITGLVSVGVYSLGFKLANVLKTVIVQPVGMAVPPLMFQMAEKPEAQLFCAQLMKWLTIVVVFPAIGLSLFGQETVKVLAADNPDYWEAWKVIPFISFGIVFGMLRDQVSYGLQIVKRTGVLASVTVVVSLLNLGFNVLFIPCLGATGAGLSMLLAQMVYFWCLLYYGRRYYPVPYELKKVLLCLVLGAALCLVAFMISDWQLGWRLPVKLLLLAGYPAVLYLFRFYGIDELRALRRFLRF